MKSKTSDAANILGQVGEDFSAEYLEKQGYKIIDRNYKIRTAEIDIIAELDKTIIFVEVKTRSNIRHGFPVEAAKNILILTAGLMSLKFIQLAEN